MRVKGGGGGGVLAFTRTFLDSFGFVGPSMAFLGVKGVLEMIVRHRVPFSLNVSSD